MDIGALLNVLDRAGTLGALALFAVSMLKGWLVAGWTFKQEREEKLVFRDIALKSLSTAESIGDVASRAVKGRR